MRANKKADDIAASFVCTRDRTRTDKVVTPLEPETSASTNFATRVFDSWGKDTANIVNASIFRWFFVIVTDIFSTFTQFFETD